MKRTTKPNYTLTRQAFWVSFVNAWAVVNAIVWYGLQGSANAIGLASIVVPAMVALIVALLGVHRHYGAVDMRTQADAASAAPAPDPSPQEEEKP